MLIGERTLSMSREQIFDSKGPQLKFRLTRVLREEDLRQT